MLTQGEAGERKTKLFTPRYNNDNYIVDTYIYVLHLQIELCTLSTCTTRGNRGRCLNVPYVPSLIWYIITISFFSNLGAETRLAMIFTAIACVEHAKNRPVKVNVHPCIVALYFHVSHTFPIIIPIKII